MLLASASIALLPRIGRAAGEEDFASWLAGLRRDALAQGIGGATLDRAFAGVAPIARVLELDRRQPETTLTFDEYIARVVTPQRRETGRERLDENRALLTEVARRYNVQPRFIVALWGIETDFGRLIGSYPVIAALATLAYDGRRAAFFRRELMNALVILDRTHIDPSAMLGSWAGAMGQSQFMPSSFLRYAVSYRGDGAPDIWRRRDDVFASIANYLAQSGWRGDENWGRRVSLPARFDDALAGLETRRRLPEWAAVGVRRVDGGALPNAAKLDASLLLPGGSGGPAILVYSNFRTLLLWNNSKYFATAVGYLADSLE
ncbi:MAG TPA: lytic murein transglycosylase [Stellaceae bacterium]|nr:lytic murein transglycosylase [Stellaceae bacterium]